MRIKNLCVVITFHYDPIRLQYLEKVTLNLDSLADQVQLFIVTNQHESEYLELIRKSTRVKQFQIISSGPLSHRYYLTWQHLEIFRDNFLNNLDISHFLYLESDIQIKENNVCYWLKAREDLKKYGLIPSFLLYEVSDKKLDRRSNSVVKPMIMKNIPKIKISESYYYLNMSNPYQAMYLLDRELAQEHLFDNPLENRETIWGIRETAASGLTFVNVPDGFSSRVVVGFDNDSFIIDSDALIHHLPNNYVTRRLTEYGKIKIQDLVVTRKNMFCFAIDIKILLLHFIWRLRKTRVKYIQKIKYGLEGYRKKLR